MQIWASLPVTGGLGRGEELRYELTVLRDLLHISSSEKAFRGEADWILKQNGSTEMTGF